MTKDERKKQKKLAKKSAKRAQQWWKRVQREQRLRSLTGMMKANANGEILQCSVGDSLNVEYNGMLAILLVRRAARGKMAYASFLVDRWCLGVKDVVAGVASPSELKKFVDDFVATLNVADIEPSQARTIVEEAVEYSRALGLSPHADYSSAQWLWGAVEATELPMWVEFGRDGRPCYMPGPYEDSARQNFVRQMLTNSVGRDGFRLMLPNSEHAPMRMA